LVSTSNATLSFSGNNGTLDTNNGLNGIVSGTAFNIGSGKYTLDITSNVGSNSPISGYNFLVTAAPVPEPTEGALLFSGIGLLGFIAARRKNNT